MLDKDDFENADVNEVSPTLEKLLNPVIAVFDREGACSLDCCSVFDWLKSTGAVEEVDDVTKKPVVEEVLEVFGFVAGNFVFSGLRPVDSSGALGNENPVNPNVPVSPFCENPWEAFTTLPPKENTGVADADVELDPNENPPGPMVGVVKSLFFTCAVVVEIVLG